MMPAFREMALAVSKLSPVHIITVIPAFAQVRMESTIVGLNGSCSPKIHTAVRSVSSTSLSDSFSKLLFYSFKVK